MASPRRKTKRRSASNDAQAMADAGSSPEVKNSSERCPLHPRKRTLSNVAEMAAQGLKQTWRHVRLLRQVKCSRSRHLIRLSQDRASYRVNRIDRKGQTKLINVRFGSQADILRCGSDVCFIPKSGHSSVASKCPLSANSGHVRCSRSLSWRRYGRCRTRQRSTSCSNACGRLVRP
jgi:hypothetical protein